MKFVWLLCVGWLSLMVGDMLVGFGSVDFGRNGLLWVLRISVGMLIVGSSGCVVVCV